MHIRKFDSGFSRRFFLEQLSKGVLATGVLTPLWPTIALGKTLEGVYPDEISTLEGLTGGKINTGDVINASNVEHIKDLIDPVSYLQRLKERHLVTRGWLMIEVPNLYAHDSFEVAHLISFNVKTLTQVVEKADFQIANLVKHGHPRSKLIPLYLTLLANPGSRKQGFQVRRETGVRVKRQAGLLHRRILTKLFPRQAWLPIDG